MGGALGGRANQINRAGPRSWGVSSPSWSRPVTHRWVRRSHKHRMGWLEWLGPEPLPCVPCLPREFLPPEVLAGAQLWIASMLPASWLSSLGEFPRPWPLEPLVPRPELSSPRIWGSSMPFLGRAGFLELGERFLESGAGRGMYLNGVRT